MREELIKKIVGYLQDENVAKEVQQAGNPDACYEVMKKYIPDLKKDEFVEAMRQIKDCANSKDGELTEEDLEKIAGGSDTTKAVGAVVGFIATAALAAL